MGPRARVVNKPLTQHVQRNKSYFELLKKASVNVQMEVVTWDKCEKGVGAVSEKQGCTGIKNTLDKDLALVP